MTPFIIFASIMTQKHVPWAAVPSLVLRAVITNPSNANMALLYWNTLDVVVRMTGDYMS